MQSNTGCKINVSQAQGADIEREIGLVGTRQAIEDAKKAIWEKVDSVVGISLLLHSTHTNIYQKEKNNGGYNDRRGGGGGRDNYNDYSQQQQQPSYAQPSVGGQGSPPAAPPAADPAVDVYAPYGGYQAYLAMWYASFAQQGQAGAPGGAPPGAA
jgi:far upstream element-binding protein